MFGSRNFLFAKSAAAAPVISGKLFMWGDNFAGALGTGNTTYYSSPVQVGSLTTWSKLATGNHTLAVKSTGELWSWGFNTYGGLGHNNTIARSSPVQVGALTNWATPETDPGGTSFCIKTDGTLWSFGRNQFGQLGLGNTTNYSSPKQIGSSTNWATVSAGTYFTLAVDSAGKLFAWGKNAFGQLGTGNTTYLSSPVQVGALTNWQTPSAGGYQSLCVKTDGTLWAWGNGNLGRLGLGNVTNYYSPVQVGALTNWAIPASGQASSMCTKTDGTLWTWGAGASGRLGLGNLTNYSSPKQVGALTNWSIPTSGAASNACVKTDGTLWAWGANNAGQLGLGNTTDRYSPVQIGSLTTWAVPSAVSVTMGCIQGVGTVAPVNLTVPVISGTAQEGETLSSTTGTWGQFPSSFAYQWQRGTSNIVGATSSTYTAVAADVGSTLRCVVTATNVIGATSANSANTATVIAYVGKLFSWGQNTQGTLGQNDTTNRSSPVQVGADTAWLTINAARTVAAVKTNGQLWQWGAGSFGQLGQNDPTNRSSPVQVGALTTWSKPGGGPVHTLCTKTDGTLWSWGNDNSGQLGQNTYSVALSSPVQVGALTNWSTPATGNPEQFSLCIKTDGTLWSWGNNDNGKLGLGDTAKRSSPVQVGSLTNWSKVIVSTQSTFCVKTDGTLWSWGGNNRGQLGLGDTIARSSPVQVGALTNWAVPASGGYSDASGWTVCTKTDGTLWSWGTNGNGQLGLGNTTSRSSPVQVGALTNWRIAQAGYQSCTSTKTDGTLWSWGRGGNGANDFGTLGLNVAGGTAYSSPKQVGSLTTWLVPSLVYKTVICTQR